MNPLLDMLRRAGDKQTNIGFYQIKVITVAIMLLLVHGRLFENQI